MYLKIIQLHRCLFGMRELPVLRLLPFFAVISSGHCSSSSIDQMSSAQLRACPCAQVWLSVFYHLRACKGGGDGWVLKEGGERCRSLTAGLQWVMTGLIAGKSGRLSSDRDEQPPRPLLNFSSVLLSAQPSSCLLLFVFDSAIQMTYPASPFL